jgi:hypothetical protein
MLGAQVGLSGWHAPMLPLSRPRISIRPDGRALPSFASERADRLSCQLELDHGLASARFEGREAPRQADPGQAHVEAQALTVGSVRSG